LPVRTTATARAQYLGILRRYRRATARRAARPTAARKLVEAYTAALEKIEAGPKTWYHFPRPYPDLARYGFCWIKIHRHWFAYVPGLDPIITNILDETSDIPTHVATGRSETDMA
jgi:plasmid stabilization system protein ParE